MKPENQRKAKSAGLLSKAESKQNSAETSSSHPEPRAKYLRIAESLRAGIAAGRYSNGARLPSEAELVRKFAVSRMTAVKAMRQLQQEGLLVRRTGSGSYAVEAARHENLVFGLLIPDLGETEIFEPICKGIVASPRASGHALSWGHAASAGDNKEDVTQRLCRQYIERGVDGVFFAPLEFAPHRDLVNHTVLQALKDAHIPVILLDRCVLHYPARSEYDIVGLDNRRAGYVIAEHLIRNGARRIAFLAVEGSAETVDDRMVGYREALYRYGIPVAPELILRADPIDEGVLSAAVSRQKIDALICANDLTAAKAMRTLLGLGVRIPQDVRVTGIDDVRYAELLPVPLTTIRQPCSEIGAAALAAMLERIKYPQLPARSILLNGSLEVRRSCGAPRRDQKKQLQC